MNPSRFVPRHWLYLPLSLYAAALWCQPASAQSGGAVTLYANRDYKGTSASFRVDTPDLRGYGLNDKVSSIRVPAGQTWEICQDINYGNRCQVITRSIADLHSIGWGDRVSSLRRVRSSGPGRGYPPPGSGQGAGITVFADPEFKGESATFRQDTPDLRGYALNDKISSVRISPGQTWEVCQDINYGNRCQVISNSIANLRSIGWDNRISSLRRLR